MDPLTLTSPPATIAANPSTDLEAPSRPGDGRTPKEDRPDYTCDAYREMQPYWVLCDDVRQGTKRLREKAQDYLPRFEAETLADWEARLTMSFVNDHYAQTLEDLVGLVCAEDVALNPKESPPELLELVDDIDGEGNSLAVFSRTVLEYAIDTGHAVVLADYPDTSALRAELGRDLTLADTRQRNVRPYLAAYKAPDVLSWRYIKIGSVYRLEKIVLRERVTQSTGAYGSTQVERYRVIEQPNGVGPITFTVFEKRDNKGDDADFAQVATGNIVGPKQIPIGIVYGGTKLGRLHSRPFLVGLAMTNVEEAQVQSDYAAVMHKCNVPTPVFIGRSPGQDGRMAEIQMGQGIDIPVGGSAAMLEPSGAALSATRDRLGDIRLQLRRQGATLEIDDSRRRQLTATEAAITSSQRNAKLQKSARSLRDVLESACSNLLAFMGSLVTQGGKVGVIVNTDFSSGSFDPVFVAACRDAYAQGALPLEAYLYALKHGELPDDFDAEDIALRLLSESQAAQDAQTLQDANDPNADPNADPGDQTKPKADPNADPAAPPAPGPTNNNARTAAPAKAVVPSIVPKARPIVTPKPAQSSTSQSVPQDTPADNSADDRQDAAIAAQLQALTAQVQTLAERVAQPASPPAAPAAATLPPELLALITAVMASLATRPGFPALTITKNADGSSKVEPQAPAAAA